MKGKSVVNFDGCDETCDEEASLCWEPERQLKKFRYLKRIFLFVAFFALSLNLRAPITSLPPVIGSLQNTLHISPGVAGLLTTIPVLCFGFLTPLLGWYMKRISLETAVGMTLVGIILGSLLRSGGSFIAALAGTLIIGIALTIGNISGLMVLGRDFKEHASSMTGVYVCGMSIGATWTTAASAPLAKQLGWQLSLALIPAGLAVAAVVLWGVVLFLQSRERQLLVEVEEAAPHVQVEQGQEALSQVVSTGSVLKRPIIWLLSAAFAAHTFLFYGLTAWLPSFLKESVHISVSQAGVAASLFQIIGIVGCMGIPALAATKRFSQMVLFLIVTCSWLLSVAG